MLLEEQVCYRLVCYIYFSNCLFFKYVFFSFPSKVSSLTISDEQSSSNWIDVIDDSDDECQIVDVINVSASVEEKRLELKIALLDKIGDLREHVNLYKHVCIVQRQLSSGIIPDSERIGAYEVIEKRVHNMLRNDHTYSRILKEDVSSALLNECISNAITNTNETASIEEIPVFTEEEVLNVGNSGVISANCPFMISDTTEASSFIATEDLNDDGWINDGVISFPNLEENTLHETDIDTIMQNNAEFPLLRSAEAVHDILMDGLDVILEVINNDSANSCKSIDYLDVEVNKRLTEILDELKKDTTVNDPGMALENISEDSSDNNGAIVNDVFMG